MRKLIVLLVFLGITPSLAGISLQWEDSLLANLREARWRWQAVLMQQTVMQ